MKKSLGVALLVGFLVVVGFVFWIIREKTPNPEPETSRAEVPSGPVPGLPWFVDVTTASGIDFMHFDPKSEQSYLPEVMGSGLAWIDYDNDGWPDLFCVQAGPLRPGKEPQPTCRLFRNQGHGTFTDITERVGLNQPCFGQGCAVGDYDNDGFDDLLLTAWGRVILYHNEPAKGGGRRFRDLTRQAALDNPHWGTSAAWGDMDNDGWLDLYICNYCEVDLDRYPDCRLTNGSRITCAPFYFPSTPHKLFRNNRNGTFSDISESSGIAKASPAPGLGVLMVDVDGDGLMDIWVANDLKPAYLFHNRGQGRFEEKGLFSGCALGPDGRALSGMGVAAADVDGTGQPALFVTNFQNEPNVLFRNRGKLHFVDGTLPSGLGPPSLARLGFGCAFLDADLDGILDVAVANGHIHREAPTHYKAPYAQEAQLFLGLGGGRFRDVSAQVGPYFRRPLVGRGLAVADYDNDGRPDLAFSHNGGPIILLHNESTPIGSWLSLELIGDGQKSNRNAIGARVEIDVGGTTQTHFLVGGGSYLSMSERRLFIGLGKHDKATVRVQWPSALKQTFEMLPARKRWRLREGIERAEEM